MQAFSEDIRIVSLELFDPAFAVTPGTEDDVKRRFMTLFASEAMRRGGSAEVCRATNLQGEVFALKRLRLSEAEAIPNDTSAAPPVADASPARKQLRHSASSGAGSSDMPDYVTSGHVAAFYEEYRVHLAVANLRGFPALYGFGLSDGAPVILMEWVEGTTLRDALLERATTLPDIPLPLDTVADLGMAVLRSLRRAGELSEHFVHRDLSPRNIMLRTDATPAADQLAAGVFDLCLVDFGSATLSGGSPADTTFTAGSGVWRMGTPAYAPPEMLTSDVALPPTWRQSPTIDVYALCSILYELYAGRRPFAHDPKDSRSPYRIKTEDHPVPLEPREPDGGALAAIILTGLSADQGDRPTLAQLDAALRNWRRLPGQRRIAMPHGTRRRDAAFWQPGYATRAITRRQLFASALVVTSALASGLIVSHKLRAGHPLPLDGTRYPRASGPYDGEPLFRAFDADTNSWILATADGTIACQPVSSRACGALREGLASLYDGASQRYGFVAPTDAAQGGYGWVILPTFALVGDFAEGLAAACDPQSGLWGYANARGAWAVGPHFAAAGAFSNGIAAVQDATSLRWGAIDASGTWAIEPCFATLGSRGNDGCAVAEERPGQWGIVDEQGRWTSAARFALLRRYAFGLAPAHDRERELWGYVDATGEWALEPAWRDARPFYAAGDGTAGDPSVALAAVQDASTQLWYFIHPDGSAAFQSEPRLWKLGDLHDGLAPAQATDTDDRIFYDEGDPDAFAEGGAMRYGYVDARGAWQMRRLGSLTNTAIGPAEI